MIKAKYSAAITDKPWWLAGGIPREACVAAYQPIGASDYAASKVNLANPGTNNAYEGVAPTWDSVTGWKFNGLNQYLSTNINVGTNQTWSAIIRFSNVSSGGGRWLFGVLSVDYATMFGIQPIDDQATPNVAYLNGTYIRVLPSLGAGVLAIAGNRGYRNGTADGNNITTNTGTFRNDMLIGACRSINITGYRAGHIQAFAIYNTAITAAQVAELTRFMNAL